MPDFYSKVGFQESCLAFFPGQKVWRKSDGHELTIAVRGFLGDRMMCIDHNDYCLAVPVGDLTADDPHAKEKSNA